jgi:hypothetical protein
MIGGRSPEDVAECRKAEALANATGIREKQLKAAKRFPDHTRNMATYEDCQKGFPALRYNDTDPHKLAAKWADVTYEELPLSMS